MSLAKIVASAAVLAAVAPYAAADVIDCPEIADIVPGGLCASIPSAIDVAGFDPTTAMETTSNDFMIEADAPAGTTTTLDFTFIRDDGGYRFNFGFCIGADIDPVLLAKLRDAPETVTEDDRFAFNDQCLSNIFEVFTDSGRNPDTTQRTASIEDVPVPADIIFALFPNSQFSAYNAIADPAARRASWNGNSDKPLFSLSAANPGGFDQLATFCDAGKSLLSWEDLTRAGGGAAGTPDLDFGDLTFRAEFEIVAPPPPPPTGECGVDCDSAVSVKYEQGTSASASGQKCASLCFDCEQ